MTESPLRGSGRNQYNECSLEAIRASLPPRESRAVSAWVGAFFGYQQTWLLDQSRFAYVVKARQIGASHTYAGCCPLWGLFGQDTSIVSVGEREAGEVLDKVGKHCQVLNELGSHWARVRSSNATSIRLVNGAEIVSLPATSGGRGRSGNVILDEFGYLQHPKKTIDAAAASTMHGGARLRIMSTPNGVGNLFHSIATDPKMNAGYRAHRVTIDQARADGLVIDDAALWSMALGDGRNFDQLYRCEFLDGEEQYIPSKLITDCSFDDIYCPEGDCYAGIDVGKRVDLTVLTVLRTDEFGVAHVLQIETKKRTSLDDIYALADIAFGAPYRSRRLCIDATGMGAFPAEELQKTFGRTKVEPVEFTQSSKEDMATTLYQRFASGTIRIPKSDADLRHDIAALRRSVTSAGNVRYDAAHGPKGHADRAWSLALAVHGCSRPSSRRVEVLPHAPEDHYDE